MFAKLNGMLTAGLLTLGALIGTTSAVQACDTPVHCCTYKYVTTYVCVTVCETHQEAYTKVFILYDDCGGAYHVSRTCYRTVQVPVKKVVAVTRKVLVCE